MSQSPITVTYSLEEILTRLEQKIDNNQKEINQRFEEVNQRFDTLQKDVHDLKVGQAKLEENLTGINKRLDNQEFINRSVGVGIVVALVTGIVKLFFPNLPSLPH